MRVDHLGDLGLNSGLRQRPDDALAFPRTIGIVRDVLDLAGATNAEMGTRRRHADGRRLDDLGNASARTVDLDLQQVSRRRVGHEDAVFREAVAARSERGDSG